MKFTINFLVLVVGVSLANPAGAETPRGQFKQMVEQLQKEPTDSALREKIIKIVPTLKPSPTVPDTAVAFEGRAQFAFKSAKSEGDYLVAAQEYEKAVAAAPWVLGYYTDLCTIYEKAGKFEDAKRHCGFYLSGLTDPAQMTDVKRRIAGLEFGIEKANSPQAREATLLQKVEGARFSSNTTLPGQLSFDEIFEIKGGTLHKLIRIYSMAQGASVAGYTQPGEYSIARIPYRDGAFKLPWPEGAGFDSFTIREDGLALTRISSNNTSNIYLRQ